MSISSLRYLCREGVRNMWQNRFMAIASIGVLVSCLLLTGFSYLAAVNIEHAFQWVYGQNVVVAFADLTCTGEQLTALGDRLAELDNVSEVKLVSKEESLQKYAATTPPALFESFQGEGNPLQDSFVVTFKDLAVFDQTLAAIQGVEGVEDTRYSGNIAATLTKARQVVLMVSGWVIALLLLVSLFIIANTIKLTVYNRRLEIYIMKSVGATNGFIRLPFVVEGVVLGFLSGLLSFGILYVAYAQLVKAFTSSTMFGLVRFGGGWGLLLLAFLFAGMLIGMLGSAISIGRYLRTERGD